MRRTILFILAIVACSCAFASNSLIAYFSATGNTRTVATRLAQRLGADLLEIVPAQAYSAEDLDYRNPDSRTSIEQRNPSCRPQIAGEMLDLSDYDIIYCGFPIWHGGMPRVMYTFFDLYDMSGKTLVPFCTSGSSGIRRAEGEIARLEPDALVLSGARIPMDNVDRQLDEWLNGLEEEI